MQILEMNAFVSTFVISDRGETSDRRETNKSPTVTLSNENPKDKGPTTGNVRKNKFIMSLVRRKSNTIRLNRKIYIHIHAYLGVFLILCIQTNDSEQKFTFVINFLKHLVFFLMNLLQNMKLNSPLRSIKLTNVCIFVHMKYEGYVPIS